MSTLTESLKVAVGEVVNVKSIPSRGVTRIEIEIPLECHVGATELLFGKPALVMALGASASELAPGSRYGVMAFDRAMALARPGHGKPPATPTPTSMFGGTRSVDYVALAGKVCREGGAFWRVLHNMTGMPAESEAQATIALRTALGVESRSELATNVQAQSRLTSMMASAREMERAEA